MKTKGRSNGQKKGQAQPKRRKDEYDQLLRRLKADRIDDLPKDLRGPPTNRFGGQANRRMRGYKQQGATHNRGQTITGELREAIIQDLRDRGEID